MKYDIKTARKDLYAPPSDDFVRVEVPLMPYLAMDGHGDPNTSPEYADAVAALFSVAYATKFATKARAGFDFVVGPLEGLWSSSDPAAFTRRDKASWDWTMLIPLPAEVTDADVAAGLAKAAKSKPGLPIDRVRRFDLDEGVRRGDGLGHRPRLHRRDRAGPHARPARVAAAARDRQRHLPVAARRRPPAAPATCSGSGWRRGGGCSS